MAEGPWTNTPVFKLFDMSSDPLEFKDLAAERPDIVAGMKKSYEEWFNDVTSHRDYRAPSRIHVGTAYENPVILTRQDWRRPLVHPTPRSYGYWEIEIARGGKYNITLHFKALNHDATAEISLNGKRLRRELKPGMDRCAFAAVELSPGPTRLEAICTHDNEITGPRFVELKRLD